MDPVIPLADSMCEDFDDLDRCIRTHASKIRRAIAFQTKTARKVVDHILINRER